MQVTADVKCYYCGHVSGQIIGERHQRLQITDFVPRPGFSGSLPKRGERLRCERCSGPVFLEDVSPLTIGQRPIEMKTARKTARGGPARAA